jgi:hypothetical protein
LASLRDEINKRGLFTHIAERRYRWELTYTAEAYIDLLDTFPWYRALALSKRAELYALILRRTKERAAGRLAMRFEAVLDVGRAA